MVRGFNQLINHPPTGDVPMENNLLHKIKLVVIAILAVLVLIIALQNTAKVETKLLFATVTMPRAILLFVMLAIGFVVG